MSITVILAATPKGEIGYKNTIPWKLKGDLKRFKEVTMDGIVIMGRNTHESLPKPLEGRTVMVVTSDDAYHLRHHPGLMTARSLTAAIDWAKRTFPEKEIFIAGGVRLYEEGLKIADRVLFTQVYKKPEFMSEYVHELREMFEKVCATGGSKSPYLEEAYQLSRKTQHGLIPTGNSFFGYDAIIKGFNLKDYTECDAEVVLDTKNDNRNLPQLSHSYHTYIRTPATTDDGVIVSRSQEETAPWAIDPIPGSDMTRETVAAHKAEPKLQPLNLDKIDLNLTDV